MSPLNEFGGKEAILDQAEFIRVFIQILSAKEDRIFTSSIIHRLD